MDLWSYTRIYSVKSDYLSRSASLHVPWDTRICSLLRAVPGTGRMDGTCWARMGHGRQHKLDLDTHTYKSPMRNPQTFSTKKGRQKKGGEEWGMRISSVIEVIF